MRDKGQIPAPVLTFDYGITRDVPMRRQIDLSALSTCIFFVERYMDSYGANVMYFGRTPEPGKVQKLQSVERVQSVKRMRRMVKMVDTGYNGGLKGGKMYICRYRGRVSRFVERCANVMPSFGRAIAWVYGPSD
jgi:hypothetical protein